ncbi:MAG: M28 family peptidase [Verrucomicrobiota bacterium]|nr:M28 family peptidase [Verrucomicrobiota bacterium]
MASSTRLLIPFLSGSVAAALFLTAGCRRQPRPPEPPTAAASPKAADSPKAPLSPVRSTGKRASVSPPPPYDLWNRFAGEKALAHARDLAELGPRPAGTVELEQARHLLAGSLEACGWSVERQAFSAATPRGPIACANLVARYAPGRRRPAPVTTQKAIIAAHYDTKRFTTIRFVGANDGAAGPGGLLELASVLALDEMLASQVELVLFDASEPWSQSTENDGLHGSRHFAQKLKDAGRAAQFQGALVWNLVGGAGLRLTLPPDAPAPLAAAITKSAASLQMDALIRPLNRRIWSDHRGLAMAGVPTLPFGDWGYLAYHTADDTVAQLDAESFRAAGAITLQWLRATFGAAPR